MRKKVTYKKKTSASLREHRDMSDVTGQENDSFLIWLQLPGHKVSSKS